MLAAWSLRYIGALDNVQPESNARAESGTVLVEEAHKPYTNRVAAGRHELLADEPTSVGGLDLGPNPYDYLLASLGACTSMTLRMYADHKQWPLEKVAVRLKHSKIHAQDCAECESDSGKVDRIERELEITGDLDETQRARLLEIADRCPVHRTLMGEKQILTRLV